MHDTEDALLPRMTLVPRTRRYALAVGGLLAGVIAAASAAAGWLPRPPAGYPAGDLVGLGAIGAVLGGAVGFLLGLAFWRSTSPEAEAHTRLRLMEEEGFDEPLEPRPAGPARASAWLQVVSGPQPRWVARCAMELAAHGAAAGARVIVVDAGRRLGLHRAFEAEARPGLVDCLAGPLPVLGVAQQGGVPRVLLLAFGTPSRRPVWIHLDHLLEEVRPYCDRLVLALPPEAPREIGSILTGRQMDGWWATPRGRPAPGARRQSDRLGIAFRPLMLNAGDQPSLKLLRARVKILAAMLPERTSEILPVLPAPTFARPAIIMAVPEVLDSDLQVRERLRFLAWMRRVQADGRRAELIGSRD